MECKCGCNQEVKKGNIYIWGHNTKDKQPWNYGLKGDKNYRFGKNYEEIYGVDKARIIKQNLSNSHKNILLSKEHKENIKIAIIDMFKRPEIHKKLRKSLTGLHKSQIHCENISRSLMGRTLTKEHKQHLRKPKSNTENMKKTRTELHKQHIREALNLEKTKQKMRISRKNIVIPFKDTIPEKIIQNFLTLLHKEYYTHKYINIEHGYQCDILVPVQNGINQKTIIECDGDYYHGNPDTQKQLTDWQIERKSIDDLRTKELINKGFRVIRLWDSKIRELTIEVFNTFIKENGEDDD